jgi:hypothetical protein
MEDSTIDTNVIVHHHVNTNHATPFHLHHLVFHHHQ